MKNLARICISSILTVFLLFSFTFREAKYYVVIGAFSKQSNARKFVGYARNHYLQATHEFNAERNLYYVHVMETSRKEEAKNWALYLQKEKGFNDAWIYVNHSYAANVQEIGETVPRYAGSRPLLSRYKATIDSQGSGGNSYKAADVKSSNAIPVQLVWTNADEVSYMSHIKGDVSGFKSLLPDDGKLFRFIAQAHDGKTIPAEVLLVDYKKAKKVASFTTDETVAFRSKSKNTSLTLVCDIFGYSVETRVVNLNNLSRVPDVRQNKDGVWEVKFKLKPMKENEVSILYNTTFFPEAAVLQPSSRKELDQLVSLMKANSSYKILIHSHCNQGARRPVKFPFGNKALFDLEMAVEKTVSDKKLTRQRGETIRSYLIESGIEGSRVAVFGWGSLDNLVSSTSSNTAINDRIEIELLHH